MSDTDRQHTLAAIEHIKATIGKLIPGATVEYQREIGTGSEIGAGSIFPSC